MFSAKRNLFVGVWCELHLVAVCETNDLNLFSIIRAPYVGCQQGPPDWQSVDKYFLCIVGMSPVVTHALLTLPAITPVTTLTSPDHNHTNHLHSSQLTEASVFRICCFLSNIRQLETSFVKRVQLHIINFELS